MKLTEVLQQGVESAAANVQKLKEVWNPAVPKVSPEQAERAHLRKLREQPASNRDLTNGIVDPETYAKVKPLLQVVPEYRQGTNVKSGNYVPEPLKAFIARTGIGLAQLRSMSREQIREAISVRREHTLTELNADDREKLSNLIGRDETTASFVRRTGLPVSFVRAHDRQAIEHVLDNQSQHRIETR